MNEFNKSIIYIYIYTKLFLINKDKRSKWNLHTLMRIIYVCVLKEMKITKVLSKYILSYKLNI